MDSDLFSNTTDDQQHRGSDPPARCTARAPIFLRHKDNDPLRLCFHELDRASIFISTEEGKGLRDACGNGHPVRRSAILCTVSHSVLFHTILNLLYALPPVEAYLTSLERLTEKLVALIGF